MHHYVYCIENLINGKVYVGKHSTEDLDDGYMGSGKLVRLAITKHGLENFRRHVLKEFETSEEALEFEKLLVTEEFVSDENTYNLTCGGAGSFVACNAYFAQDLELRKIRSSKGGKAAWSNPEFRKKQSELSSKRHQKRKESGIGLEYFHCDWTGRKHRPETRKKMKISHIGKHDGEKNSQFGTCWITHPELKKNQRVNKGEVEGYLADGWVKGRKMKW